MPKSKVLLVVGAGASTEVNIPTSALLKRMIGDALNIRFEYGVKKISGDNEIVEALRKYVRGPDRSPGDINPHREAGVKIFNAMHQTMSIDNYLDHHRHDEKIVLCGKLGIAHCILRAERGSLLSVGHSSHRETMAFEALESTWYALIFQLLFENQAMADLDRLFDNVSFITFNYDRCIEHYLAHAIANHSHIPLEEACNLVNRAKILHPYGQVGLLPWQTKGTDGVAFGRKDADLIAVAARLKTFTERIDDPLALNAIRAVVQEAEVIVFLGFAFHDQNMELLKPSEPSRARRVYATARSISASNCDYIREQLGATLGPGDRKIVLDSDLTTCATLFDRYGRGLRAPAQ